MAFSLPNASNKGVVFYEKDHNSYLNIHEFYFGYQTPTELLKNVVNVAQEINELENLKTNKINEDLYNLLLADNYDSIDKYCEEQKQNIDSFYYKFYKAYSLIGLGKINEARTLYAQVKREVNNFEEDSAEQNESLSLFHLLEAKYNEQLDQNYESAYNYSLVKENLESEENPDYELIEKIKTLKVQNYQNFLEKFDSLTYNEKKLITISKTDTLFNGNHIKLLNIDSLPNIKFPVNHPKSDKTYILHPHSKNTYLLLDNYDENLYADRIDEYCYLLQCLGATSISIQETKTNDRRENSKSNSKKHGEGGYMSAEFSADKNDSSKSDKLDKLISKFGREQFFNPKQKPFIPDDLIWFSHEMSWQRISNQRLNGNLLEHNEIISSNQNQILEQQEINEIKGEISILNDLFKAKGRKFDDNEANITTNQERDLQIHVKFKPLEEFGQDFIYSENVAQETNIKELEIIENVPNANISDLNLEFLKIQICINIAKIDFELSKDEIDSISQLIDESDKLTDDEKMDLLSKLHYKELDTIDLSPLKGNDLYSISLIDSLITIINSDGVIKPAEKIYLFKIANELGFDKDDIKEMLVI